MVFLTGIYICKEKEGKTQKANKIHQKNNTTLSYAQTVLLKMKKKIFFGRKYNSLS